LSSTNYSFVQAQVNSAAFTIIPATLTYTASPFSQAYGTVIPGLSGTVTGFVLGQSQASATTGTLTFGTPAAQSSNVGTYAINGSGLVAIDGNYEFAQASGNSTAFSIAPAILTYTANPAGDTYGSAIPNLSGTVTGFVLGQTQASATTGTLTFASPATQSSNVGNYAIDGSGLTANDGNYAFTQALTNAGALAINPATLTFNATDESLPAGASVADLTGTVTGFVLNDTLATATTGTATFTTTANTSSAPGTYPVTGGGLVSQDYVFVQAPGNATALTLQVSVSEAEITSILVATTNAAFLGSTGSFSGSSSNSEDEGAGDFAGLDIAPSPDGAYFDVSFQVGRHVVTYRTEPGNAPEVDAAEANSLGMASSFTTFGNDEHPEKRIKRKVRGKEKES